MRKISLFPLCLLLLGAVSSVMSSCGKSSGNDRILADEISAVVKDAPCQIGVAVITNGGDTVTVNNDSVHYPLMSVFKLHQAVALGRQLDLRNTGFDTLLTVRRAELNPDTWSPMYHDYTDEQYTVTLDRMLEYLLLYSDNNVSNQLFERLCDVAATDSVIRSLGIPGSFNLTYTEAEMQAGHDKAYDNWSSPLACAALINRLYTDSVMSADKQAAVLDLLGRCETGRERIPAGFAGNDSVKMGHRTGSGYINEKGEVVAVNDVAYITLPSGRSYALAVLVRDYAGTQESAEKLIAAVSATVYSYMNN